MITIKSVMAKMPEQNDEDYGDYKDQAGYTSQYLESHAPKELLEDMPDGYDTPRAFWRWLEVQD